MTLKKAFREFRIRGLREEEIEGQEEAYQTCLDFLAKVPKYRNLNSKRWSNALRDLVENTSGKNDCWPRDPAAPAIHEGTSILAALASDFTMHVRMRGFSVTFNICERGLKRRVRELNARRAAASSGAPTVPLAVFNPFAASAA